VRILIQLAPQQMRAPHGRITLLAPARMGLRWPDPPTRQLGFCLSTARQRKQAAASGIRFLDAIGTLETPHDIRASAVTARRFEDAPWCSVLHSRPKEQFNPRTRRTHELPLIYLGASRRRFRKDCQGHCCNLKEGSIFWSGKMPRMASSPDSRDGL
jgi:hypothetical protein